MIKKQPVLIIAILLSILVELVLMVVVYNKVGTVRLPVQMGRLLVQLILITWVLNGKSNTGVFLLTAYHVLMGFMAMHSKGATLLMGQCLIGFHFVIAIAIYFHDWIEDKMKSNKAV